jgi:hypothetical protein
MGPMTLNVMIQYLRSSIPILLADIGLLEMIATLLPNLASRVTQLLVNVVDDVLQEQSCSRTSDKSLFLNLMSTDSGGRSRPTSASCFPFER